MRLWLDAKREPEVSWVWSRTSQGAITMLRGGCVEKISFPPDQRSLTSPVIDWMLENGVHPRRVTHLKGDGVRRHRLRKTAS